MSKQAVFTYTTLNGTRLGQKKFPLPDDWDEYRWVDQQQWEDEIGYEGLSSFVEFSMEIEDDCS